MIKCESVNTAGDVQYTFGVRDRESTVYAAVAEALRGRADWCERGCREEVTGSGRAEGAGVPAPSPDTLHAHLVFGERNRLPFGKLGHRPGLTQLVNYYRGSGALCRKSKLVSALDGCDSLDWLPRTFIIQPRSVSNNSNSSNSSSSSSNSSSNVKTDGNSLSWLQELRQKRPRCDDREAFHRCWEEARASGLGSVWIAKSSSGAKGEGILISDDPGRLVDFVDGQTLTHVVQKYIEAPFLLKGDRKFDIRCWVLLDHEYNIYLMKEGVLRTSSEPYLADDLENVTSHLTNHCIQEAQSKNYGKFEEGNEMFFTEFNRYLQENYEISMEDGILPQLRRIIKTCLTAIKEEVTTDGLDYRSFQLFGFDFLLDRDFRVWLIEINGAPACATRLQSQLTQGILTLVVDRVFPPADVTSPALDSQTPEPSQLPSFEKL